MFLGDPGERSFSVNVGLALLHQHPVSAAHQTGVR